MNYKNNYGWSKLSSGDITDIWQLRVSMAKDVAKSFLHPTCYVFDEGMLKDIARTGWEIHIRDMKKDLAEFESTYGQCIQPNDEQDPERSVATESK